MLVQSVVLSLEQPAKPLEAGTLLTAPDCIDDHYFEDKDPETVVDEISEKLSLLQKTFASSKKLSNEEVAQATQELREQLTPKEGKKRRTKSPIRIGEICAIFGLKERTYYSWLSKLMKNGSLKDKPRKPRVGGKLNPHAYSAEIKDWVVGLFADRYLNGESLEKMCKQYQLSFFEQDDTQRKFLPSQRTVYNIFHESGIFEQKEPKQARHPEVTKRKSYEASAVNQVWCYDITYLNGLENTKYYAIGILDLYSRYFTAVDVFDFQTNDNVADFVSAALKQYDIAPHQLVLHSDNGSQMKSKMIKQIMNQFGVEESHSRPRVSNDNAAMERAWGSVKYGPYKLASRTFDSLEEAKTTFLQAIDYYHHTPHKSLEDCTPDAVFHGYAEEQLDAYYEYNVLKQQHDSKHFIGEKIPPKRKVLKPQILNEHFAKKAEKQEANQ